MGGESLELVIIAPLILALFMVIVAVGRYELGSGKIDQAAGAAARAASQQVSAVQARTRRNGGRRIVPGQRG